MQASLSVVPEIEAEEEAKSELESVVAERTMSSKLNTFSKMSTVLLADSNLEEVSLELVSVDWVVVEELPLLKRPFFLRLLFVFGRRPFYR